MATPDELILITNGDSWTFGCEIVDPALVQKHPGNHLTTIDYLPKNDSYRLPRIWPTKLAELLRCRVINLAEPGDDNASILARTQEYVLHLLNQGINPDRLFIIVGWTTPERRDFWYKSDDDKESYKFRLNPHMTDHKQKPLANLTKTYVLNFWNPEEYITRYITTILNFQNFCLTNKIRFLNFNAFYRLNQINIDQWQDINVEEQINSLGLGNISISDDDVRIIHKINYNTIWKTIDSIRYYNKDITNNSFKTYVDENCGEAGYTGWHPNELGHTVWADELLKYIQDHELLNI